MDLGGKALCDYSGFTMTFFGIGSMALVFFMATERLIAVRFAFFYQVSYCDVIYNDIDVRVTQKCAESE